MKEEGGSNTIGLWLVSLFVHCLERSRSDTEPLILLAVSPLLLVAMHVETY